MAKVSNTRANAVRELIQGSIDADEAARRFTIDIDAPRKVEDSRGRLQVLWKLLEDTARKFPQHHDKVDTSHRHSQ